MRQRITIVLLVFVLLLLVVLAVLTRPRSIKSIPGPFYKGGSSLQQPMIIDNQLYYFTGSSFAKLSLESGQTQRLSDYFYTKGSISVSGWTDHSVLFATSGTQDNDTFGQVILRADQSNANGSSYWWRYDFQTHQLQLLDFDQASSCNSFDEIGQVLLCIMPHNGSSHSYDFYGYSLDSRQWQKLSTVGQAVSTPSSAGNSLFYITTDLSGKQNLWSFNPVSASNKMVYESGQQLNYVSDGARTLLDQLPLTSGGGAPAISDQPVKQELVLLDGAGKAVAHKRLSGGSGQFAKVTGSLNYTLPDGNVFITPPGQSSIKQYLINQPNIASAWQNSGNTYYLDTKSNLLATKKLARLKGPDSFIEVYNVEPNPFYINVVSGNQNTVYLNDATQPFAANTNRVDSWLGSIGFDPNQFSFDWQLLNVADQNAIASNSVILK